MNFNRERDSNHVFHTKKTYRKRILSHTPLKTKRHRLTPKQTSLLASENYDFEKISFILNHVVGSMHFDHITTDKDYTQ